MFESGLSRGLLAATVALGLTGLASAQFVNNDGCDHAAAGEPDANGGCNVAGEPFQDLGVITGSGVITVTGQIGTYGAEFQSRDLDWFSFVLQGSATQINFTLTTPNFSRNVMFLGNGTGCPASTFYAVEADSPHSTSINTVAPGGYKVIVTTPFEPDPKDPKVPEDPIYSCNNYTLTIEVFGFQPIPAECGPTNPQPCTLAHETGGCEDAACCAVVCSINPLCCELWWDADCVNDAINVCGYFIYECVDPAPSIPNDCLTSPTLVEIGQTVAFNTAAANTDGPSNTATGAVSLMGKDIWYVIQSPGNGELTIDSCETTYDQMIEIYALGDSPTVKNPEDLPSLFIGQVDDTCGTVAGPSRVTLIGTVAGDYYLLRIGGWRPDATQPGASGPGSFTSSFVTSIYNTGAQKFLVDTSTGTNVNLGLSSGALSAAQPRRWLARPFTVEEVTVDGHNAVLVEEIVGKAFIPAGSTVESLNFVIWHRDAGNPAPVQADQILAGSVPLPTPFDDPLDNSANSSWPITVDPPLVLCPGDYYLTIYGAASNDFANGGSAASNWAWFIYSLAGERLLDEDGLGFTWRSSNFPSPGFEFSVLPPQYQVQSGDDPTALHTNAFKITGATLSDPTCGGDPTPPCPADLNGDTQVNGADLGILLGAWGACSGCAADLNGDGQVNGADLGMLLGAWGACPQ